MSWMLTAQGHEHHMLGPQAMANTFELEDVAHALALQNRFNGHTRRPYSVAEHSLLVADIALADGASVAQQLAALMHDAHEAYTGDVVSPVKWAVGQPWQDFEAGQAHLLRKKFGLLSAFASCRQSLHQWDLMALATERRDLTMYEAPRHAPWAILDTPGKKVLPWDDANLNSPARVQADWQEWKALFVVRAKDLARAVREVRPVVEPGHAEGQAGRVEA